MKLKDYIKDKRYDFIMWIILVLAVYFFGKGLEIKSVYITICNFMISFVYASILIREFFIKHRFYDEYLKKLEQLDKKYLIAEMLPKSDFLEGDILCDSLYDIDKSMIERINALEAEKKEFKEFIEMWIHEIKIPIASLSLINYNAKQVIDESNIDERMHDTCIQEFDKQLAHIQKLNHYIEQILFFARADAPQNDYLLKKCNLESIINKVIIANKDLLIGNHIKIERQNLSIVVVSDSKWLEFILDQIVNNAIKYIRKNSRKILFEAVEEKDKILLSITDYGMGINKSDIERVFDKTFTGKNGRKELILSKEKGNRLATSTGMGLYICKKLCSKLGHIIRIESVEYEYTKVIIAFGKDNYYNELNN